jgi:hypothetical protein
MSAQTPRLTDDQRIGILLEEYKVLYSFYTYRISSVEQRILIVLLVVSTALGLLTQVSGGLRVVLLVGLPLVVFYISRQGVLHVRSFEDSLRRIELIERRINGIAHEELLLFQTTHPSKQIPGGRGSKDMIVTIASLSLIILVGCAYIFWLENTNKTEDILYIIFLVIIGVLQIKAVHSILTYKYTPRTSTD